MAVPAISVPISKDKYGAFRVAGTRVTLDVLVSAYQQGSSPEQIHEGFPTVKLADIYAVITYYLNNQGEVDAYLHERDQESERIHRELEDKRPDIFDLRTTLLKRTTRSE